MTVYRSLQEKLGGNDFSTYVGKPGEILVNPDDATLAVSDGSTPGGVAVAGGSSGANWATIGRDEEGDFYLTSANKNSFFLYNGEEGRLDIRIPLHNDDPIPKGSVWTFYSLSDDIRFLGKYYEGEEGSWEWNSCRLNGDSYTSGWRTPANYLTTLVKVDDDVWVVSGAGLYDDD